MIRFVCTDYGTAYYCHIIILFVRNSHDLLLEELEIYS